ncbi:MAG: hypothetical protein ACW99G_12885 [Candidatus Thorarchaeota archaeon]|jgi:hypothetical protein
MPTNASQARRAIKGYMDNFISKDGRSKYIEFFESTIHEYHRLTNEKLVVVLHNKIPERPTIYELGFHYKDVFDVSFFVLETISHHKDHEVINKLYRTEDLPDLQVKMKGLANQKASGSVDETNEYFEVLRALFTRSNKPKSYIDSEYKRFKEEDDKFQVYLEEL